MEMAMINNLVASRANGVQTLSFLLAESMQGDKKKKKKKNLDATSLPSCISRLVFQVASFSSGIIFFYSLIDLMERLNLSIKDWQDDREEQGRGKNNSSFTVTSNIHLVAKSRCICSNRVIKVMMEEEEESPSSFTRTWKREKMKRRRRRQTEDNNNDIKSTVTCWCRKQ